MKGLNDPLQMVATTLGNDAPQLLNIKTSLLKGFKNVLDIAFGTKFKETTTSGAIKRVLHEKGYLNANAKLKPETNEYLAQVYLIMKRNPDVDSHEELEKYMS